MREEPRALAPEHPCETTPCNLGESRRALRAELDRSGRFPPALFQRNGPAYPTVFAPIKGDREVQRDPTHLGRKWTTRVEAIERSPELGDDFLDKIGAVIAILAVGVCDLEENPLVLFDER